MTSIIAVVEVSQDLTVLLIQVLCTQALVWDTAALQEAVDVIRHHSAGQTRDLVAQELLFGLCLLLCGYGQLLQPGAVEIALLVPAGYNLTHLVAQVDEDLQQLVIDLRDLEILADGAEHVLVEQRVEQLAATHHLNGLACTSLLHPHVLSLHLLVVTPQRDLQNHVEAQLVHVRQVLVN